MRHGFLNLNQFLRVSKGPPLWAFLGVILAACTPSLQGGPSRLYSTSKELSSLRQQVGLPDFQKYFNYDSNGRAAYRNNYITARMYAMDVEYSQYESSLTIERQGTGFIATTTSLGLTTAATLVGPVVTKNILTGVATAVTGTRAAYNDEILLKQTVEVLQSQMRANRARVAAQIYTHMREDDGSYPLGVALSELEEYYQAGTITGALVGVNATVGQDTKDAVQQKNDAIVVTLAQDDASTILLAYLKPNGVSYDRTRFKQLSALLKGPIYDLAPVHTGKEFTSERLQLLRDARKAGLVQ